MFRKFSILFLFLAIVSSVVHTFVPHHAHGETICFEEIHMEHSPEEKHPDFHPCPWSKQEIIRSQDESTHSQGCAHGALCDYHFPPILLFLGNFFNSGIQQKEITNKPYLNLYTSVDIRSTNSLRGPPQA